MTRDPLQIETRILGDAVVLDMAGEINTSAADSIEAAATDALGHDPSRLILNFDDVSFINSTGIALIVELLRTARAARVKVVACGLSDHYTEIFQITRLVDFMEIATDERTALTVSRLSVPTE